MSKTGSVGLLVCAEFAAMSLWFVASATLAEIRAVLYLHWFHEAALVSAVPAGFVIGALYVAFSGLADKNDPRYVFAIAAVLAGLFNAAVVLLPLDSLLTLFCRVAIGFCLAGVYPVGMKIVVGWGVKDRGLLVGLVVGGLTLGSAAPHLLAWYGGSNWQLTTLLASGLALTAAGCVLAISLGPQHTKQAQINPDLFKLAWSNTQLRRAFLGYLGHMWELYAMWSWIAPATAVSFALQTSPENALAWSKLTAFTAIAAGALLCPFAGVLADKIGKAELTILAMSMSGTSAILAAVVFGGPIGIVAFVFVFWGLSIIPDSAQFSALVADLSPPGATGSLMALQTALGFALTIVTVQVTPLIAEALGWPVLFCILAIGPFLGIYAMLGLKRERLATG